MEEAGAVEEFGVAEELGAAEEEGVLEPCEEGWAEEVGLLEASGPHAASNATKGMMSVFLFIIVPLFQLIWFLRRFLGSSLRLFTKGFPDKRLFMFPCLPHREAMGFNLIIIEHPQESNNVVFALSF